MSEGSNTQLLWFEMPGDRFDDYASEELDLVSMSCVGIGQLRGAEAMAEAIFMAEDVLGKTRGDRKQQLQGARKLTAFAEKEIERGFPLIHAHSLVGVWGALEVYVRDLITTWFLNVPEALSSEELSTI